MVKYIILIGVILGFLLSPDQVYLAPHVSKEINAVSKQYVTETMRCLDYVDVLGKVIVWDYKIPRIIDSGATSVLAIDCRKNQIPFHNHPSHLRLHSVQSYYRVATATELTNANQLVYMSRPDMHKFFVGKHKYVIVGANGHWAWWTHSQIEQARIRNVVLFRPLKGQSSLPSQYEYPIPTARRLYPQAAQ